MDVQRRHQLSAKSVPPGRSYKRGTIPVPAPPLGGASFRDQHQSAVQLQSTPTAIRGHHVKGAAGPAWLETCAHVIDWSFTALRSASRVTQATELYRPRRQRSTSGPVSRSHRSAPISPRGHIGVPSVFDAQGPASFRAKIWAHVALLNRTRRTNVVAVAQSHLHFTAGDVDRIADVSRLSDADSHLGHVVERIHRCTNPTVNPPSSSTAPAPPPGATPRTGLRPLSTAQRAPRSPSTSSSWTPNPPPTT